MTLVLVTGCWADIEPETTSSCDGAQCEPGERRNNFERLLLPVFERNGCLNHHGGAGGLFLDTQENLMTTGIHSPVVIPCDADNSILVQKLRDPVPFGQRMPRGGDPISDEDLEIIRNWIDNGADDPGSCGPVDDGPDAGGDVGVDGRDGGDPDQESDVPDVSDAAAEADMGEP